MTWTKKILIVANITATSHELDAALRAQAAREPSTFHLIVPATPLAGGRAAARERLRAVVERLRARGLQVDGEVGDCDPLVAVMEAWDPKLYDTIMVSTLPMRVSKWLHRGLPERIAHVTGAPVSHVVCRPPTPPIAVEPAPAHEKSLIGPLSVLGWGPHRDELAAARRRPDADHGGANADPRLAESVTE